MAGKRADPDSPFAALAGIRDALKEKERQQQAERQREAADAAARDDGTSMFRAALSGVQPLADANRADPRAAKRAPRPAPATPARSASAQSDAPTKPPALSDGFDAGHWLADDGRAFVRDGVNPELGRKLRRGDWPVVATVDLHGLRRDAARDALVAFVAQAVRKGWRCIRVVHGQGHGSADKQPVLKQLVRSWLAQHDAVLAFVETDADEGGAGALKVLLQVD